MITFALLSLGATARASHDGRWHVEERASVTEEGEPAPWSSDSVSISSDGELVAFAGAVPFLEQSTGDPRPMLYRRGAGRTTPVPANLGDIGGLECWNAGVNISGNGRYVSFSSPDRLVPADTDSGCDFYVYDRVSETFDGILVDVDGVDVEGAVLSGDGRFVALGVGDVGLVVFDRETRLSDPIVTSAESFGSLWLSADGRFLAYKDYGPAEQPEPVDVVLVDRITRTSERLTQFVTDSTDPAYPEQSWDGSFVFSRNMRFFAYATNIYTDSEMWSPTVAVGRTLVIYDREIGVNVEITVTYLELDNNLLPGPALGYLDASSISDDGQVVYLSSRPGGLFAVQPPPGALVGHLFELDRATYPSTTIDVSNLEMIDVNRMGEPGDSAPWSAAVSGDGSVVAFLSDAGNLMPGEVNNQGVVSNFPDVFVARRSAFADISGSVFEDDIEWLALQGITKGCGSASFCPDDPVTRGQMAAFLVRALGYADSGGGDLFVDDDGSIFEDDIDKLSVAGVTKGCNPPVNDRFCPDEFVTRGQMAAFLVRALGYADSGGGDLFVDDDGSIFENDIDKLSAAGVTKGCNPPVNDRFCPGEFVTRGQMAAFLARALG